jgi:hypothetical protein
MVVHKMPGVPASGGRGSAQQHPAGAVFDLSYLGDPTGDEAVAGLYADWGRRLDAQTQHEAWKREQWAELKQQEAEARQKAETETLLHRNDAMLASMGRLLAAPSLKKLLASKPNGQASAASTEDANNWPLPVKWGWFALTVGACVAAIIRFPLK